MKKMILSLCGLASFCAAFAQLSVGANTNYTMYKGDFGKSTAGFGVRVAYEADRFAGVVSFTNGFPITQEGTVDVTEKATGNSKEVAAQAKVSFKTISLMGQRTLVGDAESTGKFYLGFGASFVMAKQVETITGSYDKNAYAAPELYNDTETGFTLNGLAGGEYKIGKPSIFAEAGIALPANQVNNAYVENVIPAHFTFNLGIKIRLGGE
ncbi:MAG TPA: hypothetical protein VM871_03825 [Flavisolibacter sp.]|jgi:hypothetical protein|nr:hypothetical protein [Flavisolibacter sp.]